MIIAIITVAVAIHLTHMHRGFIARMFRGIGGFIAGFILTGCVGIIALPVIVAIICRLALMVVGF